MNRGLLTAVCVICLWQMNANPSAIASEIDDIRKIYIQTNKVIEGGMANHYAYYLSSAGWKRTSTDLEGWPADIDKHSLLEKSDVFVDNDRVIKVTYNIESPSGDWSNKKQYYLYPNGRTAFVLEQHLTFNGYDFEKQQVLQGRPFMMEIRHYFDRSGHQIKTLKRAFTAKEQRKVDERFLQYADLGVIANVTNFPFYELLSQEEGKRRSEKGTEGLTNAH